MSSAPVASSPSGDQHFTGGKHLDELDDDLRLLANGGGRGAGQQPQGAGRTRGGRKSTSSSNGGTERIDEEEEDDDMGQDPELEALANGTDPGHPSLMKSTSVPGPAARQALRQQRGKRPNRANSISEEGRFGSTHSGAGGPPSGQGRNLKNSRKSRALGRGLPKKGGAGGKGTWGKLGCELELPWVDPKDPNYESDGEKINDEEAALKLAQSKKATTKLETLVPEMSEEDVRKTIEPFILEYFENNDTMEVLFTLEEMLMNIGSRRWMIVSILVELAMDHKPSHREMSSVLISDLYQKVISQRDIGKAFDYLLQQLPDLILDTPDAPQILGNFMARSIADDCLPPKFLSTYKGHVVTEEAKSALKKADTLLSMKHGLVRLDNVWGVGGGVRPVKYLIKKIVMLLKEYLCSGDINEATLCLKELEVPHFHHELVYEAVVMTIESMHEKTEEAMCKLLQSLFRSFIITLDQMKNGFERVFDNMPEIVLDVPEAYTVLERFVVRCRAAGFVTDELARKMPSRGRKRFVSEGDGGRVKW